MYFIFLLWENCGKSRVVLKRKNITRVHTHTYIHTSYKYFNSYRTRFTNMRRCFARVAWTQHLQKSVSICSLLVVTRNESRQKATAKQAANNNSGGVKLSITWHTHKRDTLTNCSITAWWRWHVACIFSSRSQTQRLSHLVAHFKCDRIYIEWLAIPISIKVESRRLLIIYRSIIIMSVCRLHPLCIICLPWRCLRYIGHLLTKFQRTYPSRFPYRVYSTYVKLRNLSPNLISRS